MLPRTICLFPSPSMCPCNKLLCAGDIAIARAQLLRLQQEAAVIACPSIWDEPLGKTALEAIAAGSALLTTRRGGIPEVAEGRAHIVDDPSPETFAEALRKLVGDDEYRTGLQQAAWNDFPFTAKGMADIADSARCAAIKRERNAGK